MESVSGSAQGKKKIELEDLIMRKAELKQQIREQNEQLTFSFHKLFSPASISSYIFGALKTSFNLTQGVLLGFKMIRLFQKIFKKKK
jgi:hypothetical protein